MSENNSNQNTSHSNQNTNNIDEQTAHNNLDLNESVLSETMDEFDPANNSGKHQTIESEIDLGVFEARIKELEGEVKQAKEGTARANAEAYNAQKRMEQEADKSKKFALQKFARELLEIVDNLERAIESANADDPVAEGVQLTHKALLAVLNKNGVEVVDPMGEKFNADMHEAVGIDSDAEADTVGTVLQKGYSLNGRLLRPAMVRVGQ
nr:nucleotide exchange factor GrpE [uncultured Psychrobacter sp.]